MSPVRLGYWLPAITAAQQNEESATRNRRNRHTCRECAWDVYEEHAEIVLKRQKAVKILPFCTPTGNRTRIYSLGESCSIH